MKRNDLNLNNFKDGWLVGNFIPSLFKRTSVEVAVKELPKGFIDKAHYHEKCIEYNFVLSGSIKTEAGEIIQKGECFTYQPGEVSCTEVISENTMVLAIRDNSDPKDKFLV